MNGEHSLTDLVRDLIRFLSKDPLTVHDVAAKIGPVVEDSGGLMPIELRPVLPGLVAARLARYPDSGWPYILDIDLAFNSRPTIATLKNLLGDYHRALTDRGRPSEVLFYPPAEGPRWQIVVIAQLESAVEDTEATAITRIVFRRDPVTPKPDLSAGGQKLAREAS